MGTPVLIKSVVVKKGFPEESFWANERIFGNPEIGREQAAESSMTANKTAICGWARLQEVITGIIIAAATVWEIKLEMNQVKSPKAKIVPVPLSGSEFFFFFFFWVWE